MEEINRLIGGRYRLREKVGQGAMGVVWQAYDENLHRVVAAKELLALDGLDDAKVERAKARAMREARLAARLEHPNAIRVYDAVEDAGQPWLIMEYLPSRSLAAVIAEQGTLPPREVARIGCYTAAALAAAHRNGIQHRDVKPGNVLIGDQEVKITDFGISRATGEDGTNTMTGTVGTPAFFSPEVARGEDAGLPSDVFSLGATLYNAVEGTPPFGAAHNHIAMLHQVASGSIMPPANAGPLLSPVLFRLLATDPERRPTMLEAVHLLAAVVNETPQASQATVVIPATVELPVEAQPEEKAKQDESAVAAATGAAAAGLVAGAAQAEAAGLTAPGKGDAAKDADKDGDTAEEPEAEEAAEPAAESAVAAETEEKPKDEPADDEPAAPAVAAGASAAAAAQPVPAPVEQPAQSAPAPSTPAQPAPAQPAYVPPVPTAPQPAVPVEQEQERKKNPLAFIGVVLLVIAVGVGAFWLWPKGNNNANTGPSTGSSPPTSASQTQNQIQPQTSQQTTTAETTTQPQNTQPNPPAGTPSPNPPPPAAPGTAQEALTAYYALIPGNLEAGYATLTDNFKAARSKTFQSYQQWWSGFSAVQLSDFAPQGDNTVTATLTYFQGGSATKTERNTYTLVQVNGKWMIDSQSP